MEIGAGERACYNLLAFICLTMELRRVFELKKQEVKARILDRMALPIPPAFR